MINYLVINLMLSSGAIGVFYWMKIPHRIRFYVLMAAITAWLVPFGLISIELPKQTIQMLPIQMIEAFPVRSLEIPTSKKTIDWQALLFTLGLLGLIRFGFDLITTSKLLSQLKLNSKPYKNHKYIRLTKGISGAFVSGYFNPVIWVDEQLRQSETLPTVIFHEQQHIKHHDQFWLFFITLIQRLFWFNPLTYFLCQKARHSIELSCDEACKIQLGQDQYRTHLAQLFITNNRNSQTWMNNQINHKENFNIQRIKQLKQENTMNIKQRIKLTSLIILISILSLYPLFTLADKEQIPQLEAGQIYLEFKIKTGSSELKTMSMIVKNDEPAALKYDSYYLTVKSHIIEQTKNTEEPVQIINEMTLNKINHDQSQTSISTPTLLALNNTWAGIKVDGDKTNESIHIEIKTTVKS